VGADHEDKVRRKEEGNVGNAGDDQVVETARSRKRMEEIPAIAYCDYGYDLVWQGGHFGRCGALASALDSAYMANHSFRIKKIL